MAEAREKARLKMLPRIKRAAEDDWRVAAEFLRLSFPEDYRRARNTSIEVNTAVQTSGVVITPEQRDKLIVERKRRFAEMTKDVDTGSKIACVPPDCSSQAQKRPRCLQSCDLLRSRGVAADADREPDFSVAEMGTLPNLRQQY
jgi:hypothetical protein